MIASCARKLDRINKYNIDIIYLLACCHHSNWFPLTLISVFVHFVLGGGGGGGGVAVQSGEDEDT